MMKNFFHRSIFSPRADLVLAFALFAEAFLCLLLAVHAGWDLPTFAFPLYFAGCALLRASFWFLEVHRYAFEWDDELARGGYSA